MTKTAEIFFLFVTSLWFIDPSWLECFWKKLPADSCNEMGKTGKTAFHCSSVCTHIREHFIDNVYLLILVAWKKPLIKPSVTCNLDKSSVKKKKRPVVRICHWIELKDYYRAVYMGRTGLYSFALNTDTDTEIRNVLDINHNILFSIVCLPGLHGDHERHTFIHLGHWTASLWW